MSRVVRATTETALGNLLLPLVCQFAPSLSRPRHQDATVQLPAQQAVINLPAQELRLTFATDGPAGPQRPSPVEPETGRGMPAAAPPPRSRVSKEDLAVLRHTLVGMLNSANMRLDLGLARGSMVDFYMAINVPIQGSRAEAAVEEDLRIVLNRIRNLTREGRCDLRYLGACVILRLWQQFQRSPVLLEMIYELFLDMRGCQDYEYLRKLKVAELYSRNSSVELAYQWCTHPAEELLPVKILRGPEGGQEYQTLLSRRKLGPFARFAPQGDKPMPVDPIVYLTKEQYELVMRDFQPRRPLQPTPDPGYVGRGPLSSPDDDRGWRGG